MKLRMKLLKIQKLTSNVLAIGVFASLASCGLKPAALQLPLEVELDPEFTEVEQNTLKEDLEWFESFSMPRHEMNAPRSRPEMSRWFEDVFGGSESSDVLSFIDERTAYLVAPTRDLESNSYVSEAKISFDESIVAANLGVALFLHGMALSEKVYYNFDGSMIRVNNTRVGLIQLGKTYFKAFQDHPAGRVARLGLWVHEARHSDCTNGIRRSELKNLKAKVPLVDNSCGQTHVECPVGHDYEGVNACDGGAWGSYATEAILMTRISQCEDCSEEMYQNSLLIAIDRYHRVLPKAQLFSGSLGPPNMGHRNVIIEDTK